MIRSQIKVVEGSANSQVVTNESTSGSDVNIEHLRPIARSRRPVRWSSKVSVDLAAKTVTVYYQAGQAGLTDFKDAIEDQGYDVV